MQVAVLVAKFKADEPGFGKADFNETATRTQFITPLLEAFGWDVRNDAALPASSREVVEEPSLDVLGEGFSKRPDYVLRVGEERKLFIEAKKPNVNVPADKAAAFQTRRYGFSANLPIAVLTNFRHIAIYDCRYVAAIDEDASNARLDLICFENYLERFDFLWDRLSREALYGGGFDALFPNDREERGHEKFDTLFLRQVRRWRMLFAIDIRSNNPALACEELSYAVQLFLSRIVFLRICEDRNIERYATLQKLPRAETFQALLRELRRADAFYNSGMFDLIEDEDMNIRIGDETLYRVIAELYYPHSPYTFAVVETQVLGEIYEQFLGETIGIENGTVVISERPEVRESGGVVPTPQYIVKDILERTLARCTNDKSPEDLKGFRLCDPCCGSGIFMIAALDYLFAHHLQWYERDPQRYAGRTIRMTSVGWRLTFKERRRILTDHLFGVDVDASAVEVTRFSLLLKLIEDETGTGLRDFVEMSGERALPTLNHVVRCGNALVSASEWSKVFGPISDGQHDRINPFDWHTAMSEGRYDVIVANPPYTRIQHMQAYMPDELHFYQNPLSPYATGRNHNFDKYFLFIERSLSLLKSDGILGVIVPHKFMTTQAGRALRTLIAQEDCLSQIVHFGVKPVFKGVANYTCILVMDRISRGEVVIEVPDAIDAWRHDRSARRTTMPRSALGESPWRFADLDAADLFARMRANFPLKLSDVADVSVGLQTSSDEIYIFKATAEDEETCTIDWDGRRWPIERGILRPCIMKAGVMAFNDVRPNAWMIFPYEIIANGEQKRARLIQPDELASRYPNAHDYLMARKHELDSRKVTGGAAGERQFYQFGRSQSLTAMAEEKIIVQVLAMEPRYALDRAGAMLTGGGNGPYYVIRSKHADFNNKYLLALLNHYFSEAQIRTETSTFRGGYYSHGKQYIENLIVPTASKELVGSITANVDLLSALFEEDMSARTPNARDKRRRRIADVVATVSAQIDEVFGLSVEDRKIALTVPVPS